MRAHLTCKARDTTGCSGSGSGGNNGRGDSSGGRSVSHRRCAAARWLSHLQRLEAFCNAGGGHHGVKPAGVMMVFYLIQ